MNNKPLSARINAVLLVVVRRTDTQQNTEEGIDRRDGAYNFLTVGQAPNLGNCEVQRGQSRQQILCLVTHCTLLLPIYQ